MKTRLTIFCFLIFSANTFAQTYFVPRLSYNRFQLYGDNSISKWNITDTDYWEEGFSIGFAVRKDLPSFYFQTALYYADHFDDLGIVNTKVETIAIPNDPYGERELNSTGDVQRIQRIELALQLGKKIHLRKNLSFRIFAGLVPSFKFRQDAPFPNLSKDTGSINYKISRQYIVMNTVGGMHKTLAFDATLGAGFDMWNFTFDVSYNKGLTNLAHDVEFEGKIYPFTWKSKQLTFTLGWKFRIDKNRPRKQKKVERSYF